MKKFLHVLFLMIRDIFQLQFYIYTVTVLILAWINPFWIENGRLAAEIGAFFVLQFLLLHSGVFMVLSPFFVLLYLPVGLAVCTASGSANILISFLLIMTSRLVNIALIKSEEFKRGLLAVSAMGGILFLLCIIIFLVRIPEFGLNQHNLYEISKIYHNRVERNVPQMFAFLIVYLSLLGLWELYLLHYLLKAKSRFLRPSRGII